MCKNHHFALGCWQNSPYFACIFSHHPELLPNVRDWHFEYLQILCETLMTLLFVAAHHHFSKAKIFLACEDILHSQINFFERCYVGKTLYSIYSVQLQYHQFFPCLLCAFNIEMYRVGISLYWKNVFWTPTVGNFWSEWMNRQELFDWSEISGNRPNVLGFCTSSRGVTKDFDTQCGKVSVHPIRIFACVRNLTLKLESCTLNI